MVTQKEHVLKTDADVLALMKEAYRLLADPDSEYDLREFLKASGLFTVHDYESKGDRSVGTFDCGSARLKDTPKSLYRTLFLFSRSVGALSKYWQKDQSDPLPMYKGSLLTLVSPDYTLVASVEFYKYELAVYFSASKEHIEGHPGAVISGLPGSDNGIRFKTEAAKQWFGLIVTLLDREWDVYGGNDFRV